MAGLFSVWQCNLPKAVSPSLGIVIVNWNTGGHLQACLRSIAASDRAGWTLGAIVIIDNASVDGSADGLNLLGLPVSIVRNAQNRGFSAACNQGASGLSSDYLLFLNPDTALLTDSLTRALTFMDEAEGQEIGICGVRLIDRDGVPALSCARFPTLGTFFGQATGLSRLWPHVFKPQRLSADECRVTRDVDQIIGAFFLVRSAVFDLLGGFDERFFVYFEEVDFSFRARQHGFRSVYLADISILHHGGVSSGQVKATRLFYSLRSRLQYAFKHYTRLEAFLLVVVTVGIEFPSRFVQAVFRGPRQEIAEISHAYADLVMHLIGGAEQRTTERHELSRSEIRSGRP